jgi:hypothetical protein
LTIAAIATERRDMNSNQSALDDLVRVGNPTTESELLPETRKTQSGRSGAATAVEATRRPAWISVIDEICFVSLLLAAFFGVIGGLGSNFMGIGWEIGGFGSFFLIAVLATLHRPAAQPAPAGRSRLVKWSRRILSLPLNILLFPFEAPGRLYWMLDPDAKCRRIGQLMVGHITDKNQVEGEASVWYYVSYTYQVDGRPHDARKGVRSYDKLRKGDAIRVYYLPNADPLKTAIDRSPRPLAQ